MPKLLTSKIDFAKLNEQETLYVYNALDAAVTFEVKNAIDKNFDEVSQNTYQFSRSLQAPVLDMMRRGVRVDMWERDAFLAELDKSAAFVQRRLDAIAFAIWGKGLNPKSPAQVKAFLYDTMRLPPQLKRNKATGKYLPSTDRDALETLSNFFEAELIVSHILAIRELNKLASTLRSEVESDGRMRTSFNIAGTETGRFSSSSSAFETGTNLQNQTEQLRRVYMADEGKKLAYVDLEQAESRAVGFICKRLGLGEAYLQACLGGDLHTTTCRLVWPDLGWAHTAADREIAERNFYRHYSYRDMSKRGGHGTNYFGKPPTMAKHLKVQKELIAEFQHNYFRAFPEIREWHTWVAGKVQSEGQITTLTGRRRQFLGRGNDETTLREAIAYEPQSLIGDYCNMGLREVFWQCPQVELLLQVHDALLFQYPIELEDEIIPQVQAIMSSIRLGEEDDFLTIPTDAVVGWNWAKVDGKKKFWPDGNPFGLLKYRGRDDRNATPPTLLDRRIS